MKVLVTGGSGYIGAHMVHTLISRGHEVVVVDDLEDGRRERIPGIEILQLDLAEPSSTSRVADFLRDQRVDAVIHFAARKRVEESMERPAWYYQQNVGGLANLLLAMEQAGTRRLVFSSSAAVYGDAHGAIPEGAATVPQSPYGATKLVGEQLIDAATNAWQLSAASLRYFNVAGAARPELADTSISNLVPIVLNRIAEGNAPIINGDDYDTADGTCVRDYVHVADVAEAHLAVLDSLSEHSDHVIYNVGTGVGTSVREMVQSILATAGSDLQPVIGPRRPGDPPAIVARVDRIHENTSWTARHDIDDIVRSAWESRGIR